MGVFRINDVDTRNPGLVRLTKRIILLQGGPLKEKKLDRDETGLLK